MNWLRECHEQKSVATYARITSGYYQSMHLDCSSPMMELSPWAKLQTQFDSAAVKGIDHFVKVKSKSLSLIQFLSLLLIRFRQGGLGHCLQSGSVEGGSAEVKSSLNVPQSGPVGELSEAHHHFDYNQ